MIALEGVVVTLGQKIRAARLEWGMTQNEMAGDCITRNMLSKIETDSATPSVRTLEYLAKMLHLPTGCFLSDAPISDGSVPDGLDGARDAFREARWEDCIAALKADTLAGTSDEGCLLHARAGVQAARTALERGDLTAACELAEEAQYYNQAGIYEDAFLAAQLALILGTALKRRGGADYQVQRERFLRAFQDMERAMESPGTYIGD